MSDTNTNNYGKEFYSERWWLTKNDSLLCSFRTEKQVDDLLEDLNMASCKTKPKAEYDSVWQGSYEQLIPQAGVPEKPTQAEQHIEKVTVRVNRLIGAECQIEKLRCKLKEKDDEIAERDKLIFELKHELAQAEAAIISRDEILQLINEGNNNE